MSFNIQTRILLQQQAFAVSEVNLKEDPADDSIISVILHHPNQSEDNWVIIKITFVILMHTLPSEPEHLPSTGEILEHKCEKIHEQCVTKESFRVYFRYGTVVTSTMINASFLSWITLPTTL